MPQATSNSRISTSEKSPEGTEGQGAIDRRGCGTDQEAGEGKPELGSRTNSRGTAETGEEGEGKHHSEVHGRGPQNGFVHDDLVDVSAKPCQADLGVRFSAEM